MRRVYQLLTPCLENLCIFLISFTKTAVLLILKAQTFIDLVFKVNISGTASIRPQSSIVIIKVDDVEDARGTLAPGRPADAGFVRTAANW